MACGCLNLLSAECWGSGLDVAGDSDVTKREVRCTSRDKETVCACYAAHCVWQAGSQSVVFVVMKTTHSLSNTKQVYVNSNCYLYASSLYDALYCK